MLYDNQKQNSCQKNGYSKNRLNLDLPKTIIEISSNFLFRLKICLTIKNKIHLKQFVLN